ASDRLPARRRKGSAGRLNIRACGGSGHAGVRPEGKGQVEGLWADRTVGLDGVRSDIAMMRTPDGHSKLELTKYHTPAVVGAEPENPSPNRLGLHRVMFAVDAIDDTVARLRAHGAGLLGEVAQSESIFRLSTSAALRASSSPWVALVTCGQ